MLLFSDILKIYKLNNQIIIISVVLINNLFKMYCLKIFKYFKLLNHFNHLVLKYSVYIINFANNLIVFWKYRLSLCEYKYIYSNDF